jgi:hypothetical protein
MPVRDTQTPAEAHTWQQVNTQALRFGLCVKCASQPAWGHQAGVTKGCPGAGMQVEDAAVGVMP